MTVAAARPAEPAPAGVACSLPQLLLYFLRLGATGFGGPIALVGYMQKDLVEDRRWISKPDYLEGLALAQLMPGPLAAQLAIYLGWVKGRVLGATLVAVAFVLPSWLMVLGLSWLYVRYGGLSWMQGAFYGIGAAVIAVIARSAWKLVKMTLQKDRLLWGIFLFLAAVTAFTATEIVWLFLAAGAVAVLVRAPPRLGPSVALPPWILTGLSGAADLGAVWRIFLYFTEAGAFVFGSGLAIVPFLHGGVVERFHWLTERQFVDAVAVAMITPGPVVITVAFIGYLVAGALGAWAAAMGVFFPCWLLVVVPAPYYRRVMQNRQIKDFVSGVTAATTGAIAGSAVVIGRRAITDWPTLAVALATLAMLAWARKVPEPLVILGAGAAGIAVRAASGP
ncbi:MAG TPA: chromate transporter [Anaeromyxobacteraceae bacterium]|nr:chromate transporter [Anaeromyxobacteraceae bacterium]